MNVTDNVDQPKQSEETLTPRQFRFLLAIRWFPGSNGAVQDEVEVITGPLIKQRFGDLARSLLKRGLIWREKRVHSAIRMYGLTDTGKVVCDQYCVKPLRMQGVDVTNFQSAR